MELFITILQLICGLIVIGIVLFQSGKSAGLSGAIGGVADSFMAKNIHKIYRLAKRAFAGTYDDATILKWLKKFYWRFFSQQFKRSYDLSRILYILNIKDH